MKNEVKKSGNGAAIRVPVAIVLPVSPKPGDALDVPKEGDLILIKTLAEKTYDLHELAAKATTKNRHGLIDPDDSVGNEVW